MKEIIEIIQSGNTLTRGQAKYMQSQILNGEVSSEQIIEIFEAIDARSVGITVSEMLGIVEASKQAMNKVSTNGQVLDLVGTGGDQIDSFNITTAAAIVCAAMGIQVAKHGNRSATSICGSADLLEEIGVKIDLDSHQAEECLDKAGIVFLLAPNFHPAFRYVAEARKSYGKRTYFNFLGPLINPADVRYQLVGVADREKQNLMAEVLERSGTKSAWLVTSEEGMDEISISSRTHIMSVPGVKETVIDPDEFGLKAELKDIQIKSRLQSVEVFLNVINGTATKAQMDIVAINAAAGAVIIGRCQDLRHGYDLALECIVSGKAKQVLDNFTKISNEL